MIWPFSKMSRKTSPRPRVSADAAKDSGYVSRPHIEKAIADALKRRDNIVIYGPSHQGKTMLLSRQLAAADCVYIECRPDFKRTQIYRVALSSLGYAVLVEKKRRGKASTTVKLGLASMGAEASAEGELEQVMHAVTVDLKNPSEVAHLISRIKHLPWIVLNNFQFLDNATKRNLLFDLTFFAERPNISIVIVGSWLNEDYLEEIEPAVAGKFRYELVPTWSDAELREAAKQWSAYSKAPINPHLDDFLALADGDISLFRALIEGSTDRGGSALSETPASEGPPIQTIVLGRFQRGLSSKLRAILLQRETYLSYSYLRTTSRFAINPKFHPNPSATERDYIRTEIDPYTNRPYLSGKSVLLDHSGNPQYIEQITGEVDSEDEEIASFLFRKFHKAAQGGINKIELASLAQEFGEHLLPKPIALDESRLKSVFARFDEVQRQALIVPRMLAVNVAGNALEIVDRRLFLFLQSVSLEDLDELLDDAQPRSTPTPRRRNHVSPAMTEDEQAAYVARVMPEAQEVPDPDEPVEDASDEPDEEEPAVDEDTENQPRL